MPRNNNLSKIYKKNTDRIPNQNSKIQKLFSVLLGSENLEKMTLKHSLHLRMFRLL